MESSQLYLFIYRFSWSNRLTNELKKILNIDGLPIRDLINLVMVLFGVYQTYGTSNSFLFRSLINTGVFENVKGKETENKVIRSWKNLLLRKAVMVLNFRQLSFTSQLHRLEEEIINNEEYDVAVQQSLQSLIAYLESGKITNSRVNKFILKNFRKTLSEMISLWNDNEDIFREKSIDTLRGQVSELSSQLYEIFGDIVSIYSSQNMFFNNEDMAAEGRRGMAEIEKRLKMLQMREVVAIDDAVIPELYYVFLSDELTPEYIPPEELRKEIALIKFLTKKNIFDLVEKVDTNKLVYIRRVLNKELITAKNKFFNTTKLELLEEFEKVGDTELKSLGVQFGVLPAIKKEVNKMQQPVQQKKLEDEYIFASMSDLIQVMKEFLETEADITKSTPKKQKQLSMLLKLFTVDGLREYLDGYCSADLPLSDYEKH